MAEAINNNNCQLRTLILSANNISDIGAQHLAEAIDNNNCQLRKLNLSYNNISDIGAQYLAYAIKNNNCQVLTSFLSDIEVQHLAEAINYLGCQLRSLDPSENNIFDAVEQYLIEDLNKMAGHPVS